MSPAGFSFDPLFEHAGDPAFVIDPLEDRFVAANAAGCDLLGYTREELLETPVSRIHPGEFEQLQAFVGDVLDRGHGSTITLTCRVRHGDAPADRVVALGVRDDGRILRPRARPRPQRAPRRRAGD